MSGRPPNKPVPKGPKPSRKPNPKGKPNVNGKPTTKPKPKPKTKPKTSNKNPIQPKGPKPQINGNLVNKPTTNNNNMNALKEEITRLKKENESLKKQIQELKSKSSNGNNNNNNSGVSSGVSQSDAKNALAGLLGAKLGKPKPKPQPQSNGSNSGVSSGVSQGEAKNALLGLLAGKGKGKSGPPTSPKKSDEPEDVYASVFKKYEMMLKLGINIHGAIGRMTQDGIDKDIIKAFKAKHIDKLEDEKEPEVNLSELGLKPKRKIKIKTVPKMKRFHWEPIHPTRIPNTFWKNLDDSNIKYNKQHFELNFQARQRKPQKKGGNTNVSTTSNETKIWVNSRRSQQVQIGLKGVGLTNNQLTEALLRMDSKALDEEKLSKLMDIIPTTDEQTEAEKNMSGSLSQYGVSEQFFYSLCDFYNLKSRLEMWMFQMQFKEIHSTLLTQYKIIQKCCDKVKSNKKLRKLLTIILAFGNHMNAGTSKGECYGFNLKALNMLNSIKTMDNAKTLLMYVYEFCDRNYPEVLKVCDDLEAILKRARVIETDVSAKAFEKMEQQVKDIKNLIESDEIDQYDPSDRFISTMRSFYKQLVSTMKKFKVTVTNTEARAKRTMKIFDWGDVDHPSNVENLFKTLYQFIEEINRSKNKLLKLEKERIKKRKLLKKRKSQLNKNKSSQNSNNSQMEEEEKGLSYLERQARKKLKFEESLNAAKLKLQTHVRQKTEFMKTGGTLTGRQRTDSTFRRISVMHRDNLQMAEERRKLALRQKSLQFSMPLPSIQEGMNSAAVQKLRQRKDSGWNQLAMTRERQDTGVRSGDNTITTGGINQTNLIGGGLNAFTNKPNTKTKTKPKPKPKPKPINKPQPNYGKPDKINVPQSTTPKVKYRNVGTKSPRSKQRPGLSPRGDKTKPLPTLSPKTSKNRPLPKNPNGRR